MKNAIYKRVTANLAASFAAASAGTPDDDQQVDPAYVGGNLRAVVALAYPEAAAQPLVELLCNRIAEWMVVEVVEVEPAKRIEAALLDAEAGAKVPVPLQWEPRPQAAPPPPSRPVAPRDPYGRMAAPAAPAAPVVPAGQEPARDAYGRVAGFEPPPPSAPVQLDVDGNPAAVVAQAGFDQYGRPLPPAGLVVDVAPNVTTAAPPAALDLPLAVPGAAPVNLGAFESEASFAEALRARGWDEASIVQILKGRV